MKNAAATKPAPPPAASTPADDWIDDRELARRTPITRTGWQAWRSRGKGPPYYKVGKRCLYRWREVQAWLETHRTEPKAS